MRLLNEETKRRKKKREKKGKRDGRRPVHLFLRVPDMVEEPRSRPAHFYLSVATRFSAPAKPGLLSATSKHTNYEQRRRCTYGSIDGRDRGSILTYTNAHIHMSRTYTQCSLADESMKLLKRSCIQNYLWIKSCSLIDTWNLPGIDATLLRSL